MEASIFLCGINIPSLFLYRHPQRLVVPKCPQLVHETLVLVYPVHMSLFRWKRIQAPPYLWMLRSFFYSEIVSTHWRVKYPREFNFSFRVNRRNIKHANCFDNRCGVGSLVTLHANRQRNATIKFSIQVRHWRTPGRNNVNISAINWVGIHGWFSTPGKSSRLSEVKSLRLGDTLNLLSIAILGVQWNSKYP